MEKDNEGDDSCIYLFIREYLHEGRVFSQTVDMAFRSKDKAYSLCHRSNQYNAEQGNESHRFKIQEIELLG